MARKCRANIAEIAAAEVADQVGVRRQSRDLATAAKKRKLNRAESESTSPSSGDHQILSSSSSSDLDVSCCSSNRSEERIGLADLEAEDFETGTTSTHFRRCCESKETTMCDCNYESEDLDSSKLHRRRVSTAAKMPTEAELDEFFAAAEKDLQKQFIDKYNYDIVKDEPLKGRYEWIPLKP